MDEATKTKITELLAANKVFLFMKGTPEEPRCGFSARVVEVLNQTGVEFNSFDVLSNPTVWEGIKEFSNWPTIPQLYAEKKLIGGCDITLELAASGKLPEALGIQA